MIGSDDVLRYRLLFEILAELGREMADLIMNVSAMKVFKYLCIYIYICGLIIISGTRPQQKMYAQRKQIN